MLVFGSVVLAVAGNVLVARRYGRRVMSWAVPTENKHSSFVKREMYKEYWDPAFKRARWESYFSAVAEEERQQAERIYAWMMEEREREALREKLHRFYHEKVDDQTWQGFSAEDFFGAQFGEEGRKGFRRRAGARRVEALKTLELSSNPLEELKEETVKEAFRRKALACHPDRVSPEQRAKSSQEFKKVNAAFTFLMEEVVEGRKREEEDDW
ncbi:hypothetical protein NSK_005732 [Nannochloropsis salina CCMP1776]|uniref:J domain-containing protein n=1 Tax=Nannochloropsis salina CCMP1776 TaxID=1027361 RepID=A0A4D9D2Y0_9STRA|nr:hypothetical protein NSK_005732 [Nannochloropsis salina CCMP1776]|eukprot:TFJ82959.1 hypothetical protein NSK_005732 [Nannochloropsis salina CCMP1776]